MSYDPTSNPGRTLSGCISRSYVVMGRLSRIMRTRYSSLIFSLSSFASVLDRAGYAPVAYSLPRHALFAYSSSIILSTYGEFSIRIPSMIVPGLIDPDDFLTPSLGLQNGIE